MTGGRRPPTPPTSGRGSAPDEEVVLDAVDAGTSIGILVDPASGYGEYTIEVEELGA